MTPFACNEALGTALETLQKKSEITIFWFPNNYIKLNTNNYGLKYENFFAEMVEDKIWESSGIKLSRETIGLT